MKTEERELARMFRREQGLSVREVARAVGVSRSTASLWLRDVELTDAQREALIARNAVTNGQFSGSRANAELAHARRRAYQDEGRRRVRAGDPTYAAGCMLHWAEGDKGRNSVRLSNSDPELIRFFVEFLRRYFAVDDAKICLACNLFADHLERQREIEQFWLDVTCLSRTNLRRSTVNVYSRHSKKKRQNLLPYGTCKVTVHSTRIVQTIYGSIQELAIFDRPEWLG